MTLAERPTHKRPSHLTFEQREAITMPVDEPDIGENIKRARGEKNWSQAVLAEYMAKNQQSVSDWETGRNNILAGDLWLIAGLLGKPIEWFYR